MALAPQLVRQRIATALDAVSGWSEYTGAPARFPDFSTRQRMHQHFSVELGDVEIEEGRQKAPGMPLWEHVTVRWAYLIRGSDGRDDYDLALVEEAKLVDALRSTVGTDGPSCKITGITRAMVADGTYLLGTVTADAWHHYPLT